MRYYFCKEVTKADVQKLGCPFRGDNGINSSFYMKYVKNKLYYGMDGFMNIILDTNYIGKPVRYFVTEEAYKLISCKMFNI